VSFPGTEGPADAPPEQDLAGLGRLQALVASQTAGAETADAPEDDQDSGPETPQDYIDMWRERIRQNPAEVLDSIGLIPTDEGYRIADDHDSGVGRAGLLAGDLVTRVNGQTVGDVDSDRRLYDEVAASGLAQIEIERDGRLISMSFPLR
jgi:general secretion pathway protein C